MEAGEGDQVDGDGQDDARDEQPAKQLAVEAQVHEEQRHQRELGDHHEQHQGDDGVGGARDVVDADLGHGDGEQHQGDLDVLPLAGVVLLDARLGALHRRIRRRQRLVGRTHFTPGIRYTTVKITIHTTSTKCQ